MKRKQQRDDGETIIQELPAASLSVRTVVHDSVWNEVTASASGGSLAEAVDAVWLLLRLADQKKEPVKHGDNKGEVAL